MDKLSGQLAPIITARTCPLALVSLLPDSVSRLLPLDAKRLFLLWSLGKGSRLLSQKLIVYIMTDHPSTISIDSDKMETSSDTSSSSSPSISVPIQQTNLDLEKTTSTGTCRTNQSRISNRDVRTAQDWDGPDDPDNPLNWSTRKKAYHTLVPALQAFTITFGSSVYSPSTLNQPLLVFDLEKSDSLYRYTSGRSFL